MLFQFWFSPRLDEIETNKVIVNINSDNDFHIKNEVEN